MHLFVEPVIQNEANQEKKHYLQFQNLHKVKKKVLFSYIPRVSKDLMNVYEKNNRNTRKLLKQIVWGITLGLNWIKWVELYSMFLVSEDPGYVFKGLRHSHSYNFTELKWAHALYSPVELYSLHSEKLWSRTSLEPQWAPDKASIRAVILKHLTR